MTDRRLALWCAGFGLLALLALCRWPVGPWMQTSFTSLLPAGFQDRWQAQVHARRAGELDATLVLGAQSLSEDASLPGDFLDRIVDDLDARGYRPENAAEAELRRWRALAAFLSAWRWNLLTANDRNALDSAPREALADYRRFLHSPLGLNALSGLDADPAGTFRRFIAAAAPSLSEQDDGSELRLFSLAPDTLALNELAALFELYLGWKQRAASEKIAFQASGALLFGAYGAYSASGEIRSIGLVSLLALVTLLGISLRSTTALGMTLLSIAGGTLAAVLVTVTALRQLHLITLIFGATLIGIAADYALHYLCHHLDRPRGSGDRAVMQGLTLGVLSSALAFALLAFLPFPGIRQIGVFMAAGLLGSYATVCLLFPLVSVRSHGGRGGLHCGGRPGLARGWPLLAALLVATLPGLTLLSPEDDARDFYASPAVLEEDASALRGAAGVSPDSRYLLVRAPTVEALLQKELALTDRAADAGVHLQGISQVVPPAAVQLASHDLYRQLANSGQLTAHLDSLGFTPEAAHAILDDISRTSTVLTPTQLNGLDLPASLGRFLGCDRDGCASYMLITGATTGDVLDALIANHHQVTLIDPVGIINGLLRQYRHWVAGLLLAGALLALTVLALLAGWQLALRVVALPVAACVATLGLLGYLQAQFSIANLLALLLIAGVSLDYALFRGLLPTGQQQASTLAITLSALTSTLAFGMLAFSATPIIASFGLTIAVGLAIAYSLTWILPLPSAGASTARRGPGPEADP